MSIWKIRFPKNQKLEIIAKYEKQNKEMKKGTLELIAIKNKEILDKDNYSE